MGTTTTTTTTPEPTTTEVPTTTSEFITTGEPANCEKCEQGCKIEKGMARCFCYQGYKTGCNPESCDRDQSQPLPDFSSSSCPQTVFNQRVRRRNIKHIVSWKKIGDYCYANEPVSARFYPWHNAQGLLFKDAEEYCQSIGASVAYIPSREANFWVGHMFGSEEAYWMGLISKDQGETWFWKTGEDGLLK